MHASLVKSPQVNGICGSSDLPAENAVGCLECRQVRKCARRRQQHAPQAKTAILPLVCALALTRRVVSTGLATATGAATLVFVVVFCIQDCVSVNKVWSRHVATNAADL